MLQLHLVFDHSVSFTYVLFLSPLSDKLLVKCALQLFLHGFAFGRFSLLENVGKCLKEEFELDFVLGLVDRNFQIGFETLLLALFKSRVVIFDFVGTRLSLPSRLAG